ncbi:hypothetical protein BVRB_8g193870 isoform A [Beta vulgaris subsp. vulgaris]|nr:hypothetical protein BVRB_8g193870 isoform A [Beta vulgaris subsp. vulgaris]
MINPKSNLCSLLTSFHSPSSVFSSRGFLLWCLHSTFVLGKPGVAYSY